MRNILTKTLLLYVKIFAKVALFINKPKVIGITGSIGKSSLREAVYATLRDHFSTKVIEKGNSETGIPLGILGIEVKSLGYETLLLSIFDWLRIILSAPFGLFYLSKTRFLIIEMGVDEPDPPKNMEYLLSIVKPDIAVFLNVYPVHTMQFDRTVSGEVKGVERMDLILKQIAKEKGKIVTDSGCNVAVYNKDNKYINMVVASFENTGITKLVSFGKDPQNSISYRDYELSLDSTKFTFKLNQATLSFMFKKTALPLSYQEVFAPAVLVGLEVGLNLDQIKVSLEKNYKLPAGRSTVFSGVNHSVIIDSSYNSSRRSVLAFLEMVRVLKQDTGRKTVFLMGDMRELGLETEVEHKKVAEELQGVIDELYLVGPQTRDFVMPNVPKTIFKKWFENAIRAGKYLKDHLPEKAILLVKGSQNTIFLEEAIKELLENKEDSKNLCRQSKHWLVKKKSYFGE